ncbi:MAG: hypothetical protein KGK34_01995 [Chloroflexota bacterium]|nr:hypothetical protein [Chloroflexota bacterium]
MRPLLALTLVVATACGSTATTGGALPTPTASASPSPAPTAPASPAIAASPGATPIALPTFAQLSAPSQGVVWMLVAGSRLFRSSDSGTTWQERAVPAPGTRDPSGAILVAAISFANDAEGWMLVAEQPATQCQQQRSELWHTIDGAASWTQLKVAGIAFAQCKRVVAFADARRGLLAAADTSSAPTVYRTTDGGATWSSTRLPDPPGQPTQGGGDALQPIQIRWTGTTALLEARRSFAGASQRYVYRSTDAGATWTVLASGVPEDGALALVTATRWLQILPQDSKETTDAGASWHKYATDYQQAAPVAPEIVFGDPNVGYATVRGGLQRTVDGGAHWTHLGTPGAQMPGG